MAHRADLQPATGADGRVTLASADFVHEGAARTAQAAAARGATRRPRQAPAGDVPPARSSPRGPGARRIITAEHGKAVDDALGEVARGWRNVEFCTSLMHHLKGEYFKAGRRWRRRARVRQPIGVVACILRRSTSRRWCRCGWWATAIRAGNAVILKPSERDPRRMGSPGVRGGRAARRRHPERRPTVTRKAVDAILGNPHHQRGLVRGIHPDRSTSTPRGREQQACARRSAERRTT